MAHVEDLWEKTTGGRKQRTTRYGKGNRWRARYLDPDGRECSRTFARKLDADRFLSSVESDKSRGLYLDPDGGRRRFGDYALAWAATQVHRPSTRAKVETHLRRHILPTFADRPLGAVRRSEVQAWVRGLSDELAPATVGVVVTYLSAVFKAAVDDRLIPASPCSRIVRPRVEPARVDPMATEDVLALAAAVPDRYRALVMLAAGTGLRQGEALGLTLDRCDFLRRLARVDRQLVTLTGEPSRLAPPKTAASVRTVPLPAVVVDSVAAHLAAYPVTPTGYLFTSAAGLPVRRTSLAAILRAAVARAGLPTAVTFHDLRHYYASLLIRQGESVKVVQARLGHASAAETLNTYSHLWPDSEDRTRAAVDAVLGESVTAQGRHRRSSEG